jgi:hypothetical protein
MYIHFPLTQKRVMSQPKALEIAMKLEASPVGDDAGMIDTVTVGCTKNSIIRDNEGKGKA